jgi:hypothetical protein
MQGAAPLVGPPIVAAAALSGGSSVPYRQSVRTHFLNVDLDIYSLSDLQPLVTALGKKVSALHVGRYKRTYKAVLELNKIAKSAYSIILAFCALIRALPKAQRKIWDEAKIREFSVGIQVQLKPITFEITLSEETIRAASEVSARINFTIYSAAMPNIQVSQA